MAASTIAGFTVLPVLYSSSTHYIYARSHKGSKKPKRDALPEGRTLFLVNIPPDATERELVHLFKNSGTVEKVVFDYNAAGESVEDSKDSGDSSSEDEDGEEAAKPEDGGVAEDEEDGGRRARKKRKISKSENKLTPPKLSPLPERPLRVLRKTGRSAHVVFLDSSSLERALASTKPRRWPTAAGEEPSGLEHYIALYDSLRPPLDAVRDFADSSIALYEYELAKKKRKSKYRKGEAIVDEDGFTLVTRGGAYGQTLGGGVRVATKKFQQGAATKKEAKEKTGFYSFQRAEKQRKGEYISSVSRRG